MDEDSFPLNHNARQSFAAPEPTLQDEPVEGVDLSLIRWMLSLTPEERLRWLDNVVRTLHGVRRGT